MRRVDRQQAWELSTAHMTVRDARILERHKLADLGGFLGKNEYGYVFSVPSGSDGLGSRRADYEALGLSAAFCDLLESASVAGVRYLVFDRDIEINDELPSFDW